MSVNQSTPWGESDSSRVIADGIVNHITASHGGIWLSAARTNQILKPLLKHIVGYVDHNSGESWFEEDCAWSFVAVSFPEFFQQEIVNDAEKTLRNWYPKAWEDLFGRQLQPGESSTRDTEKFYQDNAENWVVATAWGSWAEHVPQGMVGVRALKGDGSKSKEESYWLVPEDEYRGREIGMFVIDAAKHIKLDFELGAPRKMVA